MSVCDSEVLIYSCLKSYRVHFPGKVVKVNAHGVEADVFSQPSSRLIGAVSNVSLATFLVD